MWGRRTPSPISSQDHILLPSPSPAHLRPHRPPPRPYINIVTGPYIRSGLDTFNRVYLKYHWLNFRRLTDTGNILVINLWSLYVLVRFKLLSIACSLGLCIGPYTLGQTYRGQPPSDSLVGHGYCCTTSWLSLSSPRTLRTPCTCVQIRATPVSWKVKSAVALFSVMFLAINSISLRSRTVYYTIGTSYESIIWGNISLGNAPFNRTDDICNGSKCLFQRIHSSST